MFGLLASLLRESQGLRAGADGDIRLAPASRNVLEPSYDVLPARSGAAVQVGQDRHPGSPTDRTAISISPTAYIPPPSQVTTVQRRRRSSRSSRSDEIVSRGYRNINQVLETISGLAHRQRGTIT